MSEVQHSSAIGKFFDSFPPVVTSIIVGVLALVLMLVVPATPVTIGGTTTTWQVIATSVLLPVLLMAAKALGVNMTTVYEVIKIGGGTVPADPNLPQAAAMAQGEPQPKSKMNRWLTG